MGSRTGEDGQCNHDDASSFPPTVEHGHADTLSRAISNAFVSSKAGVTKGCASSVKHSAALSRLCQATSARGKRLGSNGPAYGVSFFGGPTWLAPESETSGGCEYMLVLHVLLPMPRLIGYDVEQRPIANGRDRMCLDSVMIAITARILMEVSYQEIPLHSMLPFARSPFWRSLVGARVF